jgi:membrane protein DedA with SNARE-associated domain
VDWLAHPDLHHQIATHGYWAVALIIGLESMGVPLPGETMLVAACLYASRHHEMSIWGVIAAAVAGAIVGDNIGYWLGREFGYRLLLRYGGYVGVTEPRIKLGQYLFRRHGGKVVFLGRFVAVLRVLAAFLAGMNRMPWRDFLLANAAGAVVWASAFGFGAYTFGRALLRVTGPLAAGLLAIAVVVVAVAIVTVRRHEAELQAEAERALPGPLMPPSVVRPHP